MKRELDFAIDFATNAGRNMHAARVRALQSQKLDRTVVTDIDHEINGLFIQEVQIEYGKNSVVIGEEESVGQFGSGKVWVIDPIDGTGEYVDSTVTDGSRTTCVGIALLEAGVIQLSVVHNPWREEMWVADRASGTVTRNGWALNLRSKRDHQLSPLMTYDFCHWDGAAVDARPLKNYMLEPPLNYYSAISQACAVAAGDSAFAVFPGDTIHDIASGALLVELAGGVVADISGQPRANFYNLRGGTIYAANQHVCEGVAGIL